MRAGRQYERGGSMVWVAVLMAAVPAMILGSVNLERLWQGYRALRLATDAACQAAADGGLNTLAFQRTGTVVIDRYRAQQEGRTAFLNAMRPYLGKTLQAPQISFRFQGTSVVCNGQARVTPFGDLTTLLPLGFPGKLRVVTESWLRSSPLR